MRMIGIGLLACLIAAAALTLSYLDLWSRGVRALDQAISGAPMVFEPALEPLAAPSAEPAAFFRAHPGATLILSGLPSYQSATFSLPVDARPTSGYLQIDTTLQVLTGVEGALRISVNNSRRAEVLLRSGEAERSLRIVLTPEDLAAERLSVSFSLQGEGSNIPCGKDTSIDAIAEIETTSGLYLTLDAPLSSVRDRMAGWGQTARIAWPHWLKSPERARRMALATQLQQAGQPVLFAGAPNADALDTIDLRTALEIAQARPAQHDHTLHTWPQHVAASGTNQGIRRFIDTTQWRIRYDLRRYADQIMPSKLNLHMALGPLPLGDDWTLTATLNGHLVWVETVAAHQMDFAASIPLPTDRHALVNVIEVTAASTHTQNTPCSRPPERVAEMRAETQLLGGRDSFADPVMDLQARLSSARGITLHVGDDLSAPDAQHATSMLAGLVPAGLHLGPSGGDVKAHILAPSGGLLPDTVTDGQTWIVSRDPSDLSLTAMPFDADAPRGPGLAILITLPEVES